MSPDLPGLQGAGCQGCWGRCWGLAVSGPAALSVEQREGREGLRVPVGAQALTGRGWEEAGSTSHTVKSCLGAAAPSHRGSVGDGRWSVLSPGPRAAPCQSCAKASAGTAGRPLLSGRPLLGVWPAGVSPYFLFPLTTYPRPPSTYGRAIASLGRASSLSHNLSHPFWSQVPSLSPFLGPVGLSEMGNLRQWALGIPGGTVVTSGGAKGE